MGPRLFSRGNPSAIVTSPPAALALQWGRGFSAAETRTSRMAARISCLCFNGAAAFQPRKHPKLSFRHDLPFRASMGPRLFSRGNRDSMDGVENPRKASMGPRLFSRGNGIGGNVDCQRQGASMGPRLFSRGNTADQRSTSMNLACFNGAAAFQPRKPKLLPDERHDLIELQWGRGFSAAETKAATYRACKS